MTFNDYQKQAMETLIFNNKIKYYDEDNDKILARLVLGIAGEAGEVSEKMKKWLRGDYSYGYSIFKKDIKKELGDLLWYIAVVAKRLDYRYNLDNIAQANLEKLAKRKKEGKIKGSGDNR
ncbi:hypothetical protein LCGC14_1365330 [marine sediment metagenome]|uniref:NTP pyrophosphohydrolase MazG-like domain-containing protein n=1 Tax=marine sediment metagenome TaxID=412755 RepID=A0A0F9K7F4_9ZZZZ